jgi:phosphatidylserine/phosphatidylglycerophosphate/cardiolipin synthase-like enzyme
MYQELPNGDFRILESYIRALRNAKSFIYLENQFLWAPEITKLLADKLRRPPDPDFRLVIVLPAQANNGQDDTLGQISVLEDADKGHRLLVATLRSLSGERDDRLYIHAKVGIVDDRWLTVGSANLNAHSLFNDTEMNVVTDSADRRRATGPSAPWRTADAPVGEAARCVASRTACAGAAQRTTDRRLTHRRFGARFESLDTVGLCPFRCVLWSSLILRC